MRTVVAVLVVAALAVGWFALLAGRLWPATAGHQGEPIPFPDAHEWKTNFRKHSVPLGEIRSGDLPKDGIPAIERLQFDTVEQASRWLADREPVMLVERKGEARAYPLQILTWHEIANDVIGGEPTTVTFCPLCNTGIVFDRRLRGLLLDFGTTGKLYNSALVMYDRQTESWWWQVSGEAIVGDLTSAQLTFVPAQIVLWRDFRTLHRNGKVLNRNTGHRRPYGQNPYTGYDHIGNAPFLFFGPRDLRLPAMERVVTVSIGNEHVAYPFSVLQKVRVVNDTVGGKPIVVLWAPGTASALDRSDIAGSRDVGAAGVFDPVVEGRKMTFRFAAGQITDQQTASVWNVLGRATASRLRGTQLTPVVHGNHFWFSWAVFRPDTRIYRPYPGRLEVLIDCPWVFDNIARTQATRSSQWRRFALRRAGSCSGVPERI